MSKEDAESSEAIRKRVSAVRYSRLRRLKERKIYSNARMGPRDVRRFCAIGEESERLLEAAVTKLGFSARAYDRVLKVAWTIADLAGEPEISTAHISEAVQYRMMDRVR